MSKPFLRFRVCAELHAGRRSAALSQMDMARHVGCSVPTVRLAETGGGILFNFAEMASKLNLVLDGDALPGGDGVGQSLSLLRRRRGISRRALAKTASVSVPTLASLEAGHDCRMASVVEVAGKLGVTLRLRSTSVPKAFFSTVSKSSVHEAWTTPGDFLDRLYPLVSGLFALDPCSPTRNPSKAPVRAARYYTKEDDGLKLAWSGTVFMNPPYGRGIACWVAKARREVEEGHAGVVFGLVPARTDTKWWHESVAFAADIWLLRGRLRFGGTEGGAAPFASALVVWGLDDIGRAKVQDAFPASEACHVGSVRQS